MAELQTKSSGASVEAFLASLDAGARADANTIVALFTELSGEPATMWGASIVGFGRVHMVYESGRELDWFEVGFSPRKANLSLYITPGFATYEPLLAKLGKHTTGKSCLYVKRLADLDLAVLRELVAAAIAAMRAKYPAAGGEKATAKKPTAKKATAKKPTAKKPARTRA